MSYFGLRSNATKHDNGWPTDSANALTESSDVASTNVLDDTLDLYGFDFSLLPNSVSIKGIIIRTTGKKDETLGSGTLMWKVQVSYDGGIVWTPTTPKESPLLTIGSRTYYIGGQDDTWSHTWLRSELVTADNFRVRIKAGYDTTLDDPVWQLSYCNATVIYEITDQPSLYPNEPITISESLVVSRLAVAMRESINIAEHGSRPVRGTQQLRLGGTAISALRTSAGFSDVAARSQRREAFGVRFELSDAGPVIYVGDSTMTIASNTGFPQNVMQPGLMSVGEISYDGSFAEGTSLPSVEVRIANRTYANQDGGAETPKTIAEHCQGLPGIGRRLLVWAFVESGDGWKQRVVFDGIVEEIQFHETEVVLLGIQPGSGWHPVPDVVVDDDLFAYEPGSTAVETGEQIPGNRGKPVPIGIGRFDYGAVKKPSDFAAGHPFRMNNQSPTPDGDNKSYTQIALFPAMLGLKHPMMPTIHVAKQYRRIEGQAGDQQFTSWPYQNVFLYGSRKAMPAFPVLTGPSIEHVDNLKFPGDDTGTVNTNSGANSTDYVLVWTWREDEGKSVGLPFICAASPNYSWFNLAQADIGQPWVLNHHSARVMEALGYPRRLNLPSWSDGSAVDCYGVFVNSYTPRASGLFPWLKSWPPAMQAVAIPFAGPTVIESQTNVYTFQNSAGGRYFVQTPVFVMTEGTGQGSVENPRHAQDAAEITNITRVQNMAYFSVRGPLDYTNLGKITGIRFCMLWNNSTSTAVNVYLLSRFGPHNYGIWDKDNPGLESLEYANRDINTVYNRADINDPAVGSPVPVYKLHSVSGQTFASLWLLPYFDPYHRQIWNYYTQRSEQHPHFALWDAFSRYYWENSLRPSGAGDVTDKTLNLKGEWQFTTYDVGPNISQGPEVPFDFMIHVRDLSGGSPIANRYLDLHKVWMEVHFESPLNARVPDSVTYDIPPSDEHIKTRVPPRARVIAPYIQYPDVTLERPVSVSSGTVYVTGRGAVDDASGSITGTAHRLIENPVDVALALIRHYLGNEVFALRSTGTAFGSFSTARTILGATTYRMTLVVDRQVQISEVLKRIGSQCMGFFAEQLDSTGQLIWRCFIDTPDPATTDAERMYHTDGGKFRLDQMAKDSLKVSLSPIENLATHVRLQYGKHLPTGQWSNEIICSPDASNFATNAAAYMDAMEATRIAYGIENQITVEAPDIWDPVVAEILAKWHVDKVRRRLVQVEFETFAGGLDIQPGHVIKLDDTIGDRIKWPGDGSTAWSAHQLNVIQVSTRKDLGQMARVYVRAVEAYTKAV